MDTGECQIRFEQEIFALYESFQALPSQAFNLHLVSVTPADKEDDWDENICKEVTNYLNGLVKRENGSVYEANILFTIRNAIVVDIMRLICPKRGLVHCSLKKFLWNKSYGEFNNTNRQKVIEMANALGNLVQVDRLPEWMS